MSGGPALPVQVLLALPRRCIASGKIDKNVSLTVYRCGGLHGVEYASYSQEKVGTQLAAAG